MLYEIGIGIIGFLIGMGSAFILKKKQEKPEPQPESTPTQPEPEFTLKFLAILDYVNPQVFLKEIQQKKSLIITIEQLSLVPYKKHKFLSDLKKLSEEHNLIIKTISQDIYLLTSNTTPIEKEIIDEASGRMENNIEHVETSPHEQTEAEQQLEEPIGQV